MSVPSGNVFQDSTNLVFDGWNHYRDLGNAWIQQARDAITDLDTIYVEPIALNVEYDVGVYAPSFTRPAEPDEPDAVTITPNLPDDPTLDPIVMQELGEAPAEPDLSPYLGAPMPTAPTTALPVAPSVDTTLETITVPERPETELPEMGELLALELPEFQEITLPEFEGTRPVFDLEAPEDGALAWSETAHVSDLQGWIKTALQEMLQGGLGLPLAVEQSIFDRGRVRQDKANRQALKEIEEDMASRGMVEPTGILARRLREARYEGNAKVGELNTALTIERFKEAVENMRLAVGQGIQLETQLIQQTMQINDRALRAALGVREYAIQRYNALVNYANLQNAVYATEATVWKTRIDGELAKLEQDRLELQKQQLVGELNRNQVEIFKARWEGVRSAIEAYVADVQGAKVRSEMNLHRLEQGKLVLQRYETQVNAWGKMWDGYKSQVEASIGRGRFAESLANIYATQMEGYKTRGEAFFNEGKFALERNQQTISVFDAQLRRSDQDLRGQLAQLDGSLRTYAARVDKYQADAQIVQFESAALDRAAQLKAEIERNRTSVAVQVMQAQLQQTLTTAEILVEQIKAKAQALSNLAASSQAGVHLGATIGANGSASYGHSRSVSWSGEAADFSDNQVWY